MFQSVSTQLIAKQLLVLKLASSTLQWLLRAECADSSHTAACCQANWKVFLLLSLKCFSLLLPHCSAFTVIYSPEASAPASSLC